MMKIHIPSVGILADIPLFVNTDTFLDEELDVSPITIENTTIHDPLPRFTYAAIIIDGEEDSRWLIGSDTVSTGPNGLSQHVIQLVEPTKWLERFMVGNKAVTQPLYVDYLTNPQNSQPDFSSRATSATIYTNFYKTPVEVGSEVQMLPPACFSEVFKEITRSDIADLLYTDLSINCAFIGDDGEKKQEESKSFMTKLSTMPAPTEWIDTNPLPISFKLGNGGVFRLDYKITLTSLTPSKSKIFQGTYPIAAVRKASAKERTLKEAALSMIYAADTLNASETPIFRLNEQLSAYLDTITSPEITVTNATLREALDEVAKYIGAITRLDIVTTETETFYEVNFEKYCKDTEADTSELGDPVNVMTRAVSCDDYCTALDTTAENVVNYGDGGTIGDPSPQLFKTPRSEDATYRVTEGSAKVTSAFPFERIDGLVCRLYDGTKYYEFDLMPYLFESTEYGALSSYDPTYPFSKAYALCYTLGQKNITGLDFTVPNPWHEIFETPAIVNIINRENEINGLGLPKFGNDKPLDFTKLLFRVNYVPTGALRMRMRKPNSYGKPESVLAFNQSAAKLDAKAFGRSMFGSVLRIGNEVKTIQYAAKIGAKVPEKGERFGDDGYISEVHTEYGKEHKKVTLEVSEGFNRLSQFVGVNKTQRIFEISERMSLDRHIVYEDFCLIGTEKRKGTGSIAKEVFINNISAIFHQPKGDDGTGTAIVTPKIKLGGPLIVAQGFDESGGSLTPCMLPALCYGVGNAVVFTASFEDNFGAGRRIDSRKDKQGGHEYYATESDVRYTDLFGRIDTMDFMVAKSVFPTLTSDFYQAVADALPQKPSESVLDGTNLPPALALASTTASTRFKIDKDARECIKTLSYQVSFLEADGVKISPQFVESLPFAENSLKTLAVVSLDRGINNLTEELAVKNAETVITYAQDNEGKTIEVSCEIKADGVGWALVSYDPASSVVNGYYIGRFLFGQNKPVKKGETLKFYLSFFRKNNIKEV